MRSFLKWYIGLILFAIYGQVAHAQNTIQGVVQDGQTGETIIGANIVIEGSGKGTITDLDGKFIIDASAPVKLTVSYIGYNTQTINARPGDNLTISIQTASEELEEVVVVGYGIQKKESIVGAISSINNEQLVSVPVSNISQSLAGKIPGLQIVQPSGEVGRDEATIFVRGTGTYGDAAPLIVVDGIVRDNFSQIDPNEIESINVLKDASATAVYGIKGANGVIVVTTRRGSEGKPQVSVTAQGAITQPTRIPESLAAYEAAVLRNQHYVARAIVPEYTASDIANYRTGASPYTHPDVCWIDEIVSKVSYLQQYNVNISGGTPKIKYFVSGGFLGQGSNYNNDPYTKFHRYNFRSNLDLDLIKNLDISINVGARIEERTDPGAAWSQNSQAIYGNALSRNGRLYPVYNPDGSSTSGNLMDKITSSGVYKHITSILETGLNLNYDLSKLTKGLHIRAQVSYDSKGINNRLWEAQQAQYLYTFDTDSYQQVQEHKDLYYSWGDGQLTQKLYGEAGLEYNRKFGKHSVNALALVNRNYKMINTNFDYSEQGIVGRVAYDYDNLYYAEASICINGSENFPRENRYGKFPAFAVGYRLSNASFYQNAPIADVITNLKLRGSLGWVGNDKLKINNVEQRFIYLQQFTTGTGAVFGIGDTSYEAIYMGDIANTDVSWEVARKANIGLDMNFWEQTIGLSVDFFHEKRSNILTNISAIVPQYMGATLEPANIGEVLNRGFEIELNHRYKINQNWSYYIKSNFSFTRNKILQKADAQGLLPYQKEAGYAIGTPLVLNTIGVFQDYEDIYNSPTQLTLPGNIVVAPGDLKYEDINGDGQIDEADALRMGYGTTPEIQYGMTFGLAWKNLDFSVLFQGSANASFYKTWEVQWHFSNSQNVYDRHWYYWSPELGDENAQYIRLYGKYQNNEPQVGASASYAYGSANYIRLKNLEIGYNFPKEMISKIRLSGLRLFFSGNNLYTWSEEKLLDPDNRDSRGWKIAQRRAFNFGININL